VLKKNAKGVVAEEDAPPPSRMIESLKQIQTHINTNKHVRSHTWHEALLNLKFSQTQPRQTVPQPMRAST
jgi:hypothetical protein